MIAGWECVLVRLDEFGCGSMTVQAEIPECIWGVRFQQFWNGVCPLGSRIGAHGKCEPAPPRSIGHQQFFTSISTTQHFSQPQTFSQTQTIFHNLKQLFTTPDNFSQPQTNCHNPMHFSTSPDIWWQPQAIFTVPMVPPRSPVLWEPTVLLSLILPIQY